MTDLAQLIDVVRQHGEVAYAFIFAYAASHAMLMALFAGYAAQLGVLDLKLTITDDPRGPKVYFGMKSETDRDGTGLDRLLSAKRN